jgi:HK97 family phage prohead protease
MRSERIELKAAVQSAGDNGTFHGVASVYGVIDSDRDVIEKGAFTKTLRERPEVPILWYHDQSEVIGKGRVYEAGNQILIDGELDLEDPLAAKAHRRMKKGLVDSLSIGFTIASRDKVTIDRETDVRHIKELKLWEVSVVTFGAHPDAQITSVKQRDELTERLSAVEAQLTALAAEKAAPAAPVQPEPVQDHSAELAAARLRLALLN